MSFKIATAFVAVEAHDDGLRAAITSRIKTATEGLSADVSLGLSEAAVTRLDAAVHQAAGEASAGNAVEIGVGLQESLEKLREEVRAATAAAGDGQAVRVDMHVEHMDALSELRAGLDDVAASSDRTGSAVEDMGRAFDSSGQKAGSAGQSARSSSSGFLNLSGAVWAAVGAAAAFGPVLAGLPVLAGAAAGAVGTLALGLFGAVKALHDYSAVTQAAGQSSAQLAATAFSNAIAIRNAEASITDAKRQAAQNQVASAEAVANAQQGVSDAERAAGIATQNAADQVVSAQQRVVGAVYSAQQAERTYTDALYAEQQAQQALTQSREDAANQVADAKNAAVDAHLAVESAARNATAAQKNLTAVNDNAASTADQKALADFQAREAAQALVEAKQRDLEATQKANAATKAGVDGAPAVLSAQHSLAAAAQGVADAQHGVAVAAQGQLDAQNALAKAVAAQAEQQISSAESVARAQQSLADAQRSADQQRADSVRQVQRAEQSLSDTLEQQRLQSDAAAAAGSTALTKFNQDMAGLTDQGRGFVNEVLSLKDSLHQLSTTAQVTMLPGFTQMLEDAKSLLPIVDSGVSGFGRSLGDTAAAFGHLFQNRDFQASAQQFTDLMTSGFDQFASALPTVLDAIVRDGAKAGPLIKAVSTGIHDLLDSGLPAFLDGLATGSSGAASGVSALFRAADDLLGPVGRLSGAAANLLGPALADLEPDVKILADSFEKSLMPVMPDLEQALHAVVDVINQLTPILEPLIPLIADELGSALRIAAPLLEDTAGFLHDNADWLTPVAGGVLGLVTAFRGLGLAADLGKSGLKLFNTIADEFTSKGKIATTATKGWQAATSELAGTLGKAVPIIGGIVGGSLALGQWLGSVGEHARDATAEVNKFTGSIIDLSRGMPDAGAQLDFLARSAVGLNKSIGGGSALLIDVDTSLANLVSSGHADQAAAAMDSMTQSVKAGGGSIDDLRKLLPKYGDALGEAANNTKQAAGEAKTAQAPFQGLTLRLKDTAQAGSNTADDLSKIDTALTALDKQLAKQQALDDFTKALNDMKDGAAGTSKSIDGNSQSAMDNRKQLEDAVTAARHFYDAQIAAGVHVDDATAKFQGQIDALRTQAEKTYGSKKAVDAFLVSLDLIKPDYTTTLKVDDAAGRASLAGFQKILDGLKIADISLMINKIVGADGGAISVVGTNIKARAEGGPVEPGEVYQVGERGPELFQPTVPGRIIPNHEIRQVGGTTQVSSAATASKPITINFNGTQYPNVEQQADMMRRLALAVAA